MKNKQGFTLIELLAVIVLLAVISVIAVPIVLSIVNDSKASSYDSQINLIKNAAALYVSQYGDSNTKTVSLKELIDTKLMPSNTMNPITGQSFNNLTIDVSNGKGAGSYSAYEGPDLVSGLIPVYYDETNMVWRKADSTNANNNWYDYNKFKWANAVTVTSTNRTTYMNAAIGSTIPMTDINTMFVWIPRFKYKVISTETVNDIDVRFESKYAPKSTGDSINDYITHPAFTFGNEELSGIWVGKFEATGTSTAMTIKPDTKSLVSRTVRQFFEGVKTYMQGSATYGFNSDSDIRMYKYDDYNAILCLMYSKYGKYYNPSYYAENNSGASRYLYLNNSSYTYTGRSMGAPGIYGIKTPTYEYSSTGYYTYDGKCAMIHANLPAPCNSGSVGQVLTNKTLAYGASTTGTIYGIYDYYGGSFEYAMSFNDLSETMNPPGFSGDPYDGGGYSSILAPANLSYLTIDNKYYNLSSQLIYETNYEGISNGTYWESSVTVYNSLYYFARWFAGAAYFAQYSSIVDGNLASSRLGNAGSLTSTRIVLSANN